MVTARGQQQQRRGPQRGQRSKGAGWRDTVLFLAGLALTVYEATVYTGPERWHLVMLYAGMMGSPLVLQRDDRRRGEPEDDEP